MHHGPYYVEISLSVNELPDNIRYLHLYFLVL